MVREGGRHWYARRAGSAARHKGVVGWPQRVSASASVPTPPLVDICPRSRTALQLPRRPQVGWPHYRTQESAARHHPDGRLAVTEGKAVAFFTGDEVPSRGRERGDAPPSLRDLERKILSWFESTHASWVRPCGQRSVCCKRRGPATQKVSGRRRRSAARCSPPAQQKTVPLQEKGGGFSSCARCPARW
jgi:hypothetical protein